MSGIWCDCECGYVEAGFCLANCEREVELQEMLSEALVNIQPEASHD